jgi:hypothetical protein
MNFKRIICDGCKNKAILEEHLCYTAFSVIAGERTTFTCECAHCIRRYDAAPNLAAQLEQMFNKVGSSMMSDDFCAKLLAFTYHFNTELVVLHKGLNAGIMIAQEKANMKGGCVPDPVIVREFNRYMLDLEKGEEEEKEKGKDAYLKHAPWLQEIYDRYELENYYSTRKPKKEKDPETDLFTTNT